MESAFRHCCLTGHKGRNEMSTPKQNMPTDDYFRRISRIRTWTEIEEYAQELTKQTGNLYLPCDYGQYRSPRFEAVVVPKVGDEVSKGFNGDYYPQGTVVSVSATYKKITTSTGVSFYRVGKTGGWRADGTWWLVSGHRSEWNPSF